LIFFAYGVTPTEPFGLAVGLERRHASASLCARSLLLAKLYHFQKLSHGMTLPALSPDRIGRKRQGKPTSVGDKTTDHPWNGTQEMVSRQTMQWDDACAVSRGYRSNMLHACDPSHGGLRQKARMLKLAVVFAGTDPSAAACPPVVSINSLVCEAHRCRYTRTPHIHTHAILFDHAQRSRAANGLPIRA